MTLNNLRKMAIREKCRISYPLSNGMQCVVDEQGIARVPGLREIPTFNLETELGAAQNFLIDPGARKLSRAELTKLAGGSADEPAADDHEE